MCFWIQGTRVSQILNLKGFIHTMIFRLYVCWLNSHQLKGNNIANIVKMFRDSFLHFFKDWSLGASLSYIKYACVYTLVSTYTAIRRTESSRNPKKYWFGNFCIYWWQNIKYYDICDTILKYLLMIKIYYFITQTSWPRFKFPDLM